VECVEWGDGAEQRNVEVRQIGKETDKQAKPYPSCVKLLSNNSGKVILL